MTPLARFEIPENAASERVILGLFEHQRMGISKHEQPLRAADYVQSRNIWKITISVRFGRP